MLGTVSWRMAVIGWRCPQLSRSISLPSTPEMLQRSDFGIRRRVFASGPGMSPHPTSRELAVMGSAYATAKLCGAPSQRRSARSNSIDRGHHPTWESHNEGLEHYAKQWAPSFPKAG